MGTVLSSVKTQTPWTLKLAGTAVELGMVVVVVVVETVVVVVGVVVVGVVVVVVGVVVVVAGVVVVVVVGAMVLEQGPEIQFFLSLLASRQQSNKLIKRK